MKALPFALARNSVHAILYRNRYGNARSRTARTLAHKRRIARTRTHKEMCANLSPCVSYLGIRQRRTNALSLDQRGEVCSVCRHNTQREKDICSAIQGSSYPHPPYPRPSTPSPPRTLIQLPQYPSCGIKPPPGRDARPRRDYSPHLHRYVSLLSRVSIRQV